MMNPARLVLAPALLALLLQSGPGAARTRPSDRFEDAKTVTEALGTCDDPATELPAYRSYDPERDMLRALRAALTVSPERCPGYRERAVAQLRRLVGDPVRPDASLGALSLLAMALGAGTGTPADPERAIEYNRMLWLFDGPHRSFADDKTPPPGMTAAEGEAWLARPETIALLEARVAAAPTSRARFLLATVRLRKDVPGYDPARAVDLLSALNADLGVARRLATLLTDGVHVPPDHGRAARPFFYWAASRTHSGRDRAQQDLLRIARLARPAARTPEQVDDLVAMLSAAALDGIEDSEAELRRAIAMIRPRPERTASDAEARCLIHDKVRIQLESAMRWSRDRLPGSEWSGKAPPDRQPVRMAALLTPQGRVIATQIVQSSGSVTRDRDAQAVYAERPLGFPQLAARRHRWVELAPLDPHDRDGARMPCAAPDARPS